jgi:hypothetical protein
VISDCAKDVFLLANACADTKLITITNPCAYQGESYAHRGIHPASESPQTKALQQ